MNRVYCVFFNLSNIVYFSTCSYVYAIAADNFFRGNLKNSSFSLLNLKLYDQIFDQSFEENNLIV